MSAVYRASSVNMSASKKASWTGLNRWSSSFEEMNKWREKLEEHPNLLYHLKTMQIKLIQSACSA